MEPTCHYCGLTTKGRCRSVEEAIQCEDFKPGAPMFKEPETEPAPKPKQASDGGSSSYYDLPDGAVTLNDLIEVKEMSFARGNCFKALYRLGQKEGVDHHYDLNKIIYFAERMKGMVDNGQPL